MKIIGRKYTERYRVWRLCRRCCAVISYEWSGYNPTMKRLNFHSLIRCGCYNGRLKYSPETRLAFKIESKNEDH